MWWIVKKVQKPCNWPAGPAPMVWLKSSCALAVSPPCCFLVSSFSKICFSILGPHSFLMWMAISWNMPIWFVHYLHRDTRRVNASTLRTWRSSKSLWSLMNPPNKNWWLPREPVVCPAQVMIFCPTVLNSFHANVSCQASIVDQMTLAFDNYLEFQDNLRILWENLWSFEYPCKRLNPNSQGEHQPHSWIKKMYVWQKAVGLHLHLSAQ